MNKKGIKVTLLFHTLADRNHAALVLLNHGMATTSDPMHPMLRFQNLTKHEAMRIHQVLMTFGIDYEARVKGMERVVKNNLAQVKWDDVALPKGQYMSVSGVRLFGGDQRGRPASKH